MPVRSDSSKRKKILQREERERESARKYYRAWYRLIVWGGNIGVFVLAVFFLSRYSFHLEEVEFNWGQVLFILHALHFLTSIRIVKPDEIGALIFFGKPIRNVRSGIVYAPFLLSVVRTYTQNLIGLEIGTPQKTESGELIKPEVPKGAQMFVYNEPFRVTFADPRSAKARPEVKRGASKKDAAASAEQFMKVPLHRSQVTSDPHVVCFYRIADPVTFIEVTGSINDANLNINRTLRSGTQTYLAEMTPSQALQHMNKVNERLTQLVEMLVNEEDKSEEEYKKAGMRKDRWWGVDVQSVAITSLGLPRRINVELAENAAQGARNERIRSEAEANRHRLQEEGAGTAKAREDFLTAEANGLRKIAEVTKTEEGRVAAEIKAAEIGMANAENLIMAPPQRLINVIGSGITPAPRDDKKKGDGK